VRFLIDTGASGVVLTPGDARRLGFDPRRLRYTRIAETANGTVRSAPIRLDFIAVGQIRMLDFPASVNEADMTDSLLGMSFLSRLRSFEVRDGLFIMRP
jgi:aspartyl protease family protein